MALRVRNARQVKAIVETAPGVVFRNLYSAFVASGAEWELDMAQRFRAPTPQAKNDWTIPRSSSKTMLHTRSGRLRRSLRARATGKDLGSLRLRVVSAGTPYALLQEFGGKITPKKARYLTIPLRKNMTPAGNTRQSATRAIDTGAWFHESKAGNLYIVKSKRAGRKGKRHSKLTPLFKLVDEVKVPPRLKFFATWDKRAADRRRRMVRALNAALTEVQGRG